MDKVIEDGTPLKDIYDTFLNLIADDMYLEWSEDETYADLKNIFLASISKFEFPKFPLYEYKEKGDKIGVEKKEITNPETGESELTEVDVFAPCDMYEEELTREEINILSNLMIVEWLNRQLASVEVIRQNYSSRDFEFTSQANHLDKLIKLKESFTAENTRLQRLYGRRKLVDGVYQPNYDGFGGKNNAN